MASLGLNLHICTDQDSLCPHSSQTWQDLQASGIVVHRGCHTSDESHVQPQSHGLGNSGAHSRTCPQMYEAWNIALLACWKSAAEVGGMTSNDLPFGVKSSVRASSTLWQQLVPSYMRTTSRSIVGKCALSSSSVGWTLPMAAKASSTSGNT